MRNSRQTPYRQREKKVTREERERENSITNGEAQQVQLSLEKADMQSSTSVTSYDSWPGIN